MVSAYPLPPGGHRLIERRNMDNSKDEDDMSKKCECGKPLMSEDAEFWGECNSCRLRLPIHTSQGGDSGGAQADRVYHGGMGHRGEW